MERLRVEKPLTVHILLALPSAEVSASLGLLVAPSTCGLLLLVVKDLDLLLLGLRFRSAADAALASTNTE